MNKTSFIEWLNNWRKALLQKSYHSSSGKAGLESIHREIQYFIYENVISQILAGKGITDSFITFNRQSTSVIPTSISSQFQKEIAELDLGGFPFEILSDIYESFVTRKLVLNKSSGDFEHSREPGVRKGRGIYYTPRYIVRYIIDSTLGRYLWGTESGHREENTPAKSPQDICNLSILDPSCGSGLFLSYAFDVLAGFYLFHFLKDKIGWLSNILEKHLFGVDLDSNAINITKAILTLKALEIANYKPVELRPANISEGNFLTLKPSCWKSQKLSEDGFSMIIGNPPYGVKLDKTERTIIKSSYKTSAGFNSSSLFVEKSIRLLKDNGLLGFLVPKSLSYVVTWGSIREFLLNSCRITEITDVSEAFSDVLLEQIIIFAQKSDKPTKRTVVSILQPEKSITYHVVDGESLTADRFSIWLYNRRVKDLLDKIWQNSVPLGCVAEIWNGLNIQRLPIFSDSCDSEHKCPCIKGKNIQRYHIRGGFKYANITSLLSDYSRSSELFFVQKIVAQDIIAHVQYPTPHIKLMTAIDRSGEYLSLSTVTNIACSAMSLEYLCGILNSRLISWYAHNFIYNRATRTMHFRKGYAEHIPIRRIDKDTKPLSEKMIEYVTQMIRLSDERNKSGIRKIDREIDRLIYKLYGITEDEIDFLKQYAGFY